MAPKAQETPQQDNPPQEDALAIPILHSLTTEEQTRLVALAERFLQQKRFVPLQGFELDSLKSARIALLFCLPVLELGIEWLDGFHEVLIYPASFVVDDEWEDDIGLVHNQRIVQSGQSWQQGPIVLNWVDIRDSFDASGFNLIIHEVAHKLDMRNGDRASGIPLIPLREVAGWEHDLHAAMENIQKRSIWSVRPLPVSTRTPQQIPQSVSPYCLNIFQCPGAVCPAFSFSVATFMPILWAKSITAIT